MNASRTKYGYCNCLRAATPSVLSGKRVSNTWVTCLQDEDNRAKALLILDGLPLLLQGPVKLRRLEIGPRPISWLVR